MSGQCYVYDCSNRNYYGYCMTTVCINPKYNKITNSTRYYADTFVAKPVTRADRIRTMTDEQLAEWLCRKADCNEYCCAYRSYCNKNDEACKQAWLEWLKEEVNE